METAIRMSLRQEGDEDQSLVFLWNGRAVTCFSRCHSETGSAFLRSSFTLNMCLSRSHMLEQTRASEKRSCAWWELRPFLFRFYCHCQFEITEYLTLFKGLNCLTHSSEFDLRISFYFDQQVELLHETNLSFVGAKSVRPNDPDWGPSHTRCRFSTRQWCFSSCWSVMSVFPQNMQRLPTSDTFFFRIKVDLSELSHCEQKHRPTLMAVQNSTRLSPTTSAIAESLSQHNITTSVWLLTACGKEAAVCLSVRCFLSVPATARLCCIELSCSICTPVFLSQICVTAGVNSFDAKYLLRHNFHFCVVDLLRSRCVEAFKVHLWGFYESSSWLKVEAWHQKASIKRHVFDQTCRKK